ncbi:MAG TPA: lipid-A-disaccharide synthase, partial [Alphaproteobacteria bacterium]
VSGDFLGGRLMEALKKESGRPVRFSGVGGAQMQAQGLDSLFPMSDLSVMGITEVLPRLPLILRRIRQTAHHIRKTQPDIVVTIDAPDFSFRVAAALRKPEQTTLAQDIAAWLNDDEEKNLPVDFKMPRMIHYVAPTVWAWRPERAAKVARLYDGILCLFPFEPPWFRAEGMQALFTGHPVTEAGLNTADDKKLRGEMSIPTDVKILGVLFGSRMGELNRTGPALRETAYRLAQERPGMHLLTLTLPHLERELRNLLQGMPCKVHVLSDQARKGEAFAAMHAALATSGTVGMELAVAGIPHAIAYRANALTAFIVKRKVTVRHAHLLNILFEDEIVPEFIQGKCTAENILPAMKTLMDDDIARARQKLIFDNFRSQISAPNGASSPQMAAKFVLGGDTHGGQ